MKKIAVIALMLVATLSAFAQSKNGNKLSLRTMYIFAYSQNLCDSIVYLSAIQPVEVQVNKAGEVEGRATYSEQFKAYVTQAYNEVNQTGIVVIDSNRKVAESKYLRLRRRFITKDGGNYREVPLENFKFVPFKYDYND